MSAASSKSVIDLMVVISNTPAVDFLTRLNAAEIATQLRHDEIMGGILDAVFDRFRPAPR